MPDDAEPLTEAELVAIFLKDNKMTEFLRLCREINPQKNGVITVVELDDILRLLYEEELEGRDLTELYEPFCSIQNKILVDWKGFRDKITTKMREIEANFQILQPSVLSSQKMTPAGTTKVLAFKNEDGTDFVEPTPSKKEPNRSAERSRHTSLKKGQGEHVSSQGIIPLKECLQNETSKREFSKLRNMKSATELAYFK